MGGWGDLAAFRRAHAAGRLRTRISAAVPLERWARLRDTVAVRGRGDEWLRIGGLKGFVDGSLGSHTAAMHRPFTDAPADSGLLVTPADSLYAWISAADRAGLQVMVHAIGDRANTLALDAYAATGARGRVEHAQLLSPADLGRFAELGLVASVQPEHAVDDRDVADHYWAGRTHRSFAYRSLLDAGARLVLGSDAPVAPLDPWVTLAAAVHRSADGRPSWHPEQEIPLDVALAASAGPSGPVGVGRTADLVITDLDPAAVAPDRLRAMPVTGTLLAGRWTHRAGI
jgi:predicted amidohydrolase YtcJ